MQPREKNAFNYNEAIKEKFSAHPQIRRISKHRQVPKYILNAQNQHREMHNKEKRKEANRIIHSKNRDKFKPEKKKHVISEEV